MINSNDPETYYKICVEKDDKIDKIMYALMSIAGSLLGSKINIGGSKEFVKKMEGVIGKTEENETEGKVLMDSVRTPQPTNCERCNEVIIEVNDALTYWFSSHAFCSGLCRAKWREDNPDEEDTAENRPQKTSKPRVSKTGGTL